MEKKKTNRNKKIDTNSIKGTNEKLCTAKMGAIIRMETLKDKGSHSTSSPYKIESDTSSDSDAIISNLAAKGTRNKHIKGKKKSTEQKVTVEEKNISVKGSIESDTSSESDCVLSDLADKIKFQSTNKEKEQIKTNKDKMKTVEQIVADERKITKKSVTSSESESLISDSEDEREFQKRNKRVIGEMKSIEQIVADEKKLYETNENKCIGEEESRKKKLDDNSVTEGVAEPACSCKRVKYPETIDSLIENIVQSKRPMKAVMSDDFYKPMTFTKVFIGQVKDVKELSKVIVLLNQKIPLGNLSHLKRAFRKEVVLFPVSTLNSQAHASIQYYIEENVNELRNSFEYFKIIEVPTRAPKIRKQYNECGKSWSINFHPDKYLEQLYGSEVFSEEETEQHRFYMSMAFEVALYYMKKEKDILEPYDILSADLNATIVVDPSINSVVAVAFDNRAEHPLQHSAMIAVDNVAKTQKGGAWDTSDIDSINLRGIGYMELLLHLKHKYPNVKFGAKAYISKDDLDENDLSASDSPYLCTGYYIYMIREPCIMCAMALVHARSKRVFFCLKNSVGALNSLTKLQCMQSLNHRFEVFTDFL